MKVGFGEHDAVPARAAMRLKVLIRPCKACVRNAYFPSRKLILNHHISTLRHQGILSVSLLLLAIWLAWEIGLRIASQDLTAIAYVALCFVGIGVAVTVLRNWRLGFYFFLVWLLFEDLVRKYLGNNMAIYFAKDS